MWIRGVVVAAVFAGVSCFSTARYDDAHMQRVQDINARFDADNRREQLHYTTLEAELDNLRAFVIPIAPDAELESLLAFSHNQALLRRIDEQTGTIAQLRVHARRSAERERRREIEASTQLRDREIAAGLVARSARVKAAADAYAAAEHGVPHVARTIFAAPAARPSPTLRCTSEDTCALGDRCIVPRYASSGTCVPALDDCRNQPAERPRRDPIEPNMAIGCKSRRDCRGGCTCDGATGACAR